jgi:hypothetical protein
VTGFGLWCYNLPSFKEVKNAIAKGAKLKGNGSCDKGFQRLEKYQGENVPNTGPFMENCS